ncbi:MAG: segregation and condensation protein A [Oscillospiraceae bacterium]
MELEFKLENFQGPLDLLLHLISKHKLDICDIEISVLLEQYLNYLNNLDEKDYDSAGDFLAMAARLIYIKTASLLPKPEDANQLKQDLQGQIIEYSICKQTALLMQKNYAGGNVFVRAGAASIIDKTFTGTKEPVDLYNAYMGISEKGRKEKPVRAEMFSPIVSTKFVSVTSKIIFVLKKLYKTGVYKMAGLYEGITNKSEKIATFLAVLELTKSGRIYINHDNSEIRFIPKEKHKRSDNVSDESENVKNDDNISGYNENAVQPENKDEYVISIEDETADDFLVEQEEKTQEQNVVTYSEKVTSGAVTLAVANTDIHTINDEQAEDAEFADNEQDLELEEYLRGSFKPNYWNMRSYFWGNVHIGDDTRNGYWQFG